MSLMQIIRADMLLLSDIGCPFIEGFLKPRFKRQRGAIMQSFSAVKHSASAKSGSRKSDEGVFTQVRRETGKE